MNARPEFFTSPLAAVDAEVFAVINAENQRQEDHIELIASENYTSKAVMQTGRACSPTNTPRATLVAVTHGGCEYVDVAETLAIERPENAVRRQVAVNVQPHSGAQANAGGVPGADAAGRRPSSASRSPRAATSPTAWRST